MYVYTSKLRKSGNEFWPEKFIRPMGMINLDRCLETRYIAPELLIFNDRNDTRSRRTRSHEFSTSVGIIEHEKGQSIDIL